MANHCEECGKPETDQYLVPSHGGVNELWCLDCMRLAGRCISCSKDIRLIVENYSEYEHDECPECMEMEQEIDENSVCIECGWVQFGNNECESCGSQKLKPHN